MDTPWGPLAHLDPSDNALAAKIITADKDTLVEGLIAEDLFQQFLGTLKGRGVSILDLETAIAAQGDKRYAFVWSRSWRQRGLRRYLDTLEQVTTQTYAVDLLDGDFVAAPYVQGRALWSKSMPLTRTAEALTGQAARVNRVSLSVRDESRQLVAFWGNSSERMRKPGSRWEQIILPRLFFNHGLGPYFRQLWNLDRACATDSDLWLLEVKHKYPFGQRALKFGVNRGELENIRLLASGPKPIRCLHTLLVKPIWSPGVSPMYLLSDLKLRQKVALIATELSAPIDRILAQEPRKGPSHTTLAGEGAVYYNTVPVTAFQHLGKLTDPVDSVGANMANMLSGCPTRNVRDSDLRALRAPECGAQGQ